MQKPDEPAAFSLHDERAAKRSTARRNSNHDSHHLALPEYRSARHRPLIAGTSVGPEMRALRPTLFVAGCATLIAENRGPLGDHEGIQTGTD